MENAAEALKMAAWVLIFVVALSVTMNALTNIKQSVDSIMVDSDREYNTRYIDGSTIGERVVSAEDIIQTIYRVYKNARYIIEFPDVALYYDTKTNQDVSYIDLTTKGFADDRYKDYFIKRIMTGKDTDEEIQGYKIKDLLKKNYNISFKNNIKLYDLLKGKKFTEKLGIAYQEELEKDVSTKAKKTEIRIITYEKLL